MALAQWRTPASCVAAAVSPAVPGTALVTEPCAPLGTASQAWFFEIVDEDTGHSAYRARIHLGDSGLCAAVPAIIHENFEALALTPCTSALNPTDPQLFWLAIDGTVSFGTSCVAWQDPPGSLFLSGCGGHGVWFLSGALENDAGMALTESSDGSLVAAPVEPIAPPAQTFDFYF